MKSNFSVRAAFIPRILQAREYYSHNRSAKTPSPQRLQRYLHRHLADVDRSPSRDLLEAGTLPGPHKILRVPDVERSRTYALCQRNPPRPQTLQPPPQQGLRPQNLRPRTRPWLQQRVRRENRVRGHPVV